SALKKLKESLRDIKIVKTSKKASKKKQLEASLMRKEAKEKFRELAKQKRQNNPFELKQVSQKHEILGRKVKGVVGRPLEQKSRGIEKRKQTIGLMLKNKNRESLVVDRRFGERDASMSLEDKMLQRMMKEKVKTSKKQFNLEDDVELTHMGQSLDAIDDFNDAGLEKVDNDSDNGMIDENVVKAIHFGGFGDEPKKSRNEIMKEVIQKSKQHKRERQMQKEFDMDMMDEVDQDLDEIRGLMVPMNAPGENDGISADRLAMIRGETERVNENLDQDYDKAVREMIYDKRARPTDRVKTEEEIANENLQKLLKQEEERVKRMQGVPEEKKRQSQADDLGHLDYQNHVKEQVEREQEMPLTYKDGVLVNKEIFFSRPAEASGSDSGSEEESGSEESDDSDEESEDGSEVASGDEESEQESGDEEEAAALSGKKSTQPASDEESEEELSGEELSGEEGPAELPFTFDAPQTYEDLLQLFQDRTFEEHITIIERLRILNNHKLGPTQKQNLELLMTHLVEHMDTAALDEEGVDMDYLRQLEHHTVELCTLFHERFATLSRAKIIMLRDNFNKSLAKRINGLPHLGDLMFFKILVRVYSTSDLQHAVVTPLMLLMSQYLSQGLFETVQDIVTGLFLCQLLLECTKLSKRVVPEMHCFLNTVIAHSLSKETNQPSILPQLDRFRANLAIQDFSVPSIPLKLGSLLTEAVEWSDALRLSIMIQSFVVMKQVCAGSTQGAVQLFDLTMTLLKQVPHKQMDKSSLKHLDAVALVLKQTMDDQLETQHPLQLQKRKQMAIKSFMPKFEKNYSVDRKSYDPNRDRIQKQKMQAEYKKEFKGAVRELRKDAQFIHKTRLDQTKQKDAEYKRKMDAIVGHLAQQEGAMRGYEREKKKPRK
ncbi:nucleolar protein 14, partial [Gorgonomyces haynaldii]